MSQLEIILSTSTLFLISEFPWTFYWYYSWVSRRTRHWNREEASVTFSISYNYIGWLPLPASGLCDSSVACVSLILKYKSWQVDKHVYCVLRPDVWWLDEPPWAKWWFNSDEKKYTKLGFATPPMTRLCAVRMKGVEEFERRRMNTRRMKFIIVNLLLLCFGTSLSHNP